MKLRDDAVLPSRAHSGDAGFDLSACEEVTIGVGERAAVGTGIAVEIPEGHADEPTPRRKQPDPTAVLAYLQLSQNDLQ